MNLRLVCWWWFGVVLGGVSVDAVEVLRLPLGAMQPFVVTDESGSVHMVWLQGKPEACDVWYQKFQGGRTNDSVPFSVNHRGGDAIAIGTIRGAQIAVGRNGRVHVVWNGSSSSKGKDARGVPLLYSRMNDAGTAFEQEINLLGKTALLDGGVSVAADPAGNVHVVWHAAPESEQTSESDRRVFVATSTNDGVTFTSERSIGIARGVCGCCSLRAIANPDGSVVILYRSALTASDRSATMVWSIDHGNTFEPVFRDPWMTAACPMSSASLARSSTGLVSAWETQGTIRFAMVHPQTQTMASVKTVSTRGKAKHPTLAINGKGEVLCTWAEDTGWQRGGKVVWCRLDLDGNRVGTEAILPDLPVWSFPAAFARDDGEFVVVY